ncbi:hypothetical protein [Halodesulfurarchaeum formicicum]|uniref:hypothetical protein n=1 Tax=Halodesulfurarchaeum formicicum TaxID=1873524 RepID=UPI000903C393|nr:hypothetical protein [Halodesulfurarchaeum formicicum]
MKGGFVSRLVALAVLLWVPSILVVYPPQPVGGYFGLSRSIAIEAFFVGVLVTFFSYLLFQVYRYYLLGEPTDLDHFESTGDRAP